MAPVKPVRVGFIAQSLAILTLSTAIVNAQAQPKTPRQSVPALMTAEIENEETHVWRVRLPPGTTSNFHRHNHPRVVVVLTGGAVKLLVKGAAPRTLEWRSGKTYWVPADQEGVVHAYSNDGDRPIEFIYVEFERSE